MNGTETREIEEIVSTGMDMGEIIRADCILVLQVVVAPPSWLMSYNCLLQKNFRILKI